MATKSIRLSDGTDTLLPESASYSVINGCKCYKFADGTLIEWGTKTWTVSISDWVAWGGIYYIPASDIAFGMQFASDPYINMMKTLGNAIIACEGVQTDHGIHNIYLYRPTTASGDITVNWIAIGRWK